MVPIRYSVLLALATVLACSNANAQQRGTGFGGSGSLFGGGSGFGGENAGGRGGFGQSAFGGQGGFGQQGFSGGQSAFGPAPAGGQNNNGFVGRNAADAQGFFQQLGRGNRFLQRLERSFGEGANRGRGAELTQEKRPPVRVPLKLGFTPPTNVSATRSAAATRIEASMAIKGYRDAHVTIGNGVATLNGQVATDSDRLLIERITRLEPGIARVENRLTVAGANPESIPPAPN